MTASKSAFLAAAALGLVLGVSAPGARAEEALRSFGQIDQLSAPESGPGGAVALEQIFDDAMWAGLPALDAGSRRQTSTHSRAIIQQMGDTNRFEARQTGPGNLIVGVQEGSRNAAGAVQAGAHNTVLISQFGNGNTLPEITQSGDGSFAAWEQIGNGWRGFKLHQSTGSPPVTITQRR